MQTVLIQGRVKLYEFSLAHERVIEYHFIVSNATYDRRIDDEGNKNDDTSQRPTVGLDLFSLNF